MEIIELLKCPITDHEMEWVEEKDFPQFDLRDDLKSFGELTGGVVDRSRQYFYPVFSGIIVLHPQYATFIGHGDDPGRAMSFDKKRVFEYYNQINYLVKDSLKIYADSAKWVDFRNVSSRYIRQSFTRASRHYPGQGKYLLDIASGPIGLPEYLALSDGYECRICIDISINALLQAKANMEEAKKKGIFICGDITNIPLRDNVCDTVLSQHTLYHVPKDDQHTAVLEMYRVAKPGSSVVIVYNWFYHSWFMNISLHVVQLYRILRHYAGKWYVRLFPSKPRLYFYVHSPRWFKRSFEFSEDIEFFCWRSTNKYFLKMYIHPWLFGEQILDRLTKVEDKYTRFMGTFGAYPAIVITKRAR